MYKKIIMAVVLIAYGTDTFTQHLDDSRNLLNASKHWNNQSQLITNNSGWKERFYSKNKYHNNIFNQDTFDAMKNDSSGLGLFSKDANARTIVMSGAQGGFIEMLNAALQWAVEKQKLEEVLGERTSEGNTPLLLAIMSHRLNAVRSIVQYAKENNILESVLTAQNNQKANCLMKAIAVNNPLILDLLYHEAEGNGLLKTLMQQEDHKENTAYFWCVSNAGQSTLQELDGYAERLHMQHRLFDINTEKQTCLIGALTSKNKDSALYILDRLKRSGMNEDARAAYLNQYDTKRERTALQWLMRMTEGAKVKSDSLATPFKVNDALAITESILSNKGVDVLKPDHADRSVVYWAQFLGLTDIVESLRSYMENEYPDDKLKQRQYNNDIATANQAKTEIMNYKRRKLDEERN